MNFRKKVGIIACLFLCALSLPACAEKDAVAEGQMVSFQEPHMGTLFTIRVWVPKSASVEDCSLSSRKAFERIAALNEKFSDYLVESELSLLSKAPANQPIAVSDELLDVLLLGQALSKKTDGAFDVTIGPMVRLWRRARKSQQLPSEVQISGAKARTGYTHLLIDKDRKTVTKKVEHMVLDLGGIAKGYAADEVLKIMKAGGFPHTLVAASGDIAFGDPPKGLAGWSVGLETMEMATPGEASFQMANGAVSTSGDTQRFLVIEGKRYSHIVDKDTGFGLTERIAVSVIAPNATTSDSYATAVSVLGREKGLELIDTTPGLECRIVTITGEAEAKIYYSSGYPGQGQ